MAPSAVQVEPTPPADSINFLKENAKATNSSRDAAPARIPPSVSQISIPSNAQHEEYQYLHLIETILETGEYRPDRTGTGTLSVPFPPQLRFSLSTPTTDPLSTESFTPILPLLTTKRVFLRAVLEELLWFVSGCTSSKPLEEKGIHIWDGNGSREYLDSIGLSHRVEGDLGPVYGFQWRHFGADYVDAKTNYHGQGVDQIKEIVRKLQENPYDRRIILSAWNVADLGKMALPPCHMFAQFYVSFPGTRPPPPPSTQENENKVASEANGASSNPRPKGHLHCLLYQRSCDMGLGVPFNIASYALLTHMLAHACDLIPGSLVHTMGDAHVYLDHVDALREQLTREPRDFPRVHIRRVDRGQGVVDGWKAEELDVQGYRPMGGLKMKMSV